MESSALRSLSALHVVVVIVVSWLTVFAVCDAKTTSSPREIAQTASRTCEYDGKRYTSGPVNVEPCITCLCDGQTGQLSCSYKECPVQDDPSCTVYGTPEGQCCPRCLEHGCFHEGRGFPLGARIPRGPCEYCYCPWSGDGSGRPVCLRMTCEEPECSNAVIPPGMCCPVCPSQPSTSEDALLPYAYDDSTYYSSWEW